MSALKSSSIKILVVLEIAVGRCHTLLAALLARAGFRSVSCAHNLSSALLAMLMTPGCYAPRWKKNVLMEQAYWALLLQLCEALFVIFCELMHAAKHAASSDDCRSLFFDKAAKGDLRGSLERVARCVEVFERFPGLCRLPMG